MTETNTMTKSEIETNDPVLTAEETAKYLRVHLNTAFKLLRTHVIPATKVGGQWRVRKSVIDEFLGTPRRQAQVYGSLDTRGGEVLIIGPSGSGKTAIARELSARYPDMRIEEVQVPWTMSA